MCLLNDIHVIWPWGTALDFLGEERACCSRVACPPAGSAAQCLPAESDWAPAAHEKTLPATRTPSHEPTVTTHPDKHNLRANWKVLCYKIRKYFKGCCQFLWKISVFVTLEISLPRSPSWDFILCTRIQKHHLTHTQSQRYVNTLWSGDCVEQVTAEIFVWWRIRTRVRI